MSTLLAFNLFGLVIVLTLAVLVIGMLRDSPRVMFAAPFVLVIGFVGVYNLLYLYG